MTVPLIVVLIVAMVIAAVALPAMDRDERP
jgi:hypothetical protein